MDAAGADWFRTDQAGAGRVGPELAFCRAVATDASVVLFAEGNEGRSWFVCASVDSAGGRPFGNAEVVNCHHNGNHSTGRCVIGVTSWCRLLCGGMTIRPVVLLDMDGVLADFDGYVASVWPHADKPLIRHEDRREFYIAKDHPQYPKALFRRIVEAPGFFRELPPIAGALEAVEALMERAEVYVCTAPMASHPSCADEKRAWIAEHMPGGHRYWAHRTIITNDKTLVYGDALVDDRPEVKGHRRQPDWVHILYRQPYNVDACDDPDGSGVWVSWTEDDPYLSADIILHAAQIEASSRQHGHVARAW